MMCGDQLQFPLQPPAVVPDLACGRALMDAPFAALFEFEVLDGIGQVARCPIDPGFAERSVEQLACRADEGAPLPVFLVSRLLSDEGDSRALWSFTENCTGITWNKRR
jgi:hypothetical protein